MPVVTGPGIGGWKDPKSIGLTNACHSRLSAVKGVFSTRLTCTHALVLFLTFSVCGLETRGRLICVGPGAILLLLTEAPSLV